MNVVKRRNKLYGLSLSIDLAKGRLDTDNNLIERTTNWGQ